MRATGAAGASPGHLRLSSKPGGFATLTEVALVGSPGLLLFDCNHFLHANIQRIGHFLETLYGYPFVSRALVALDLLFWKFEPLGELFPRPVSRDTRLNERYGALG